MALSVEIALDVFALGGRAVAFADVATDDAAWEESFCGRMLLLAQII